jgi:predicted deacetylase
MKFAIRDDDLNYFFKPVIFEKTYKQIWNICPVSMSAVPFIKGNWPKNVKEAEEKGPGFVNGDYTLMRKADCEIFPIHENSELVDYVKIKINQGKIYLTIHAIHHRNEDPIIPQFNNNYGFGAEFYTTRDLTNRLMDAIKYLEDTFEQTIKVFTPPQNMYNTLGLKAVTNNNLAICGDLPSIRQLKNLRLIGFKNFIKYFQYKLNYRRFSYPYPIINNQIKIVGHQRLQPGTDIQKLYEAFEHAYKLDGVFVVSTHSYAFEYKMKTVNDIMGNVLIRLVEYAANKKNINFVTLDKVFE